jgi:hypothetical protein
VINKPSVKWLKTLGIKRKKYKKNLFSLKTLQSWHYYNTVTLTIRKFYNYLISIEKHHFLLEYVLDRWYALRHGPLYSFSLYKRYQNNANIF